MPIRIPDALPATEVLENENIFVMTENRAIHQDIRPLKVLLLNLMPTKIVTETQIMRKLSNTPLQVEVELLQTASHSAKNVSEDHLATFYRTFDQVRNEHFDGMIITGAPVELLDFEDVDYWDELVAIMDWSLTNVHSTLHICWGAQAGIYHHYGVPKYELPAKRSGVFEHRVVKPSSPLVRGFDDRFRAPHSRYTEVHAADIEAHPNLELIAVSDEAGVYVAKSRDSRHFFVFGHPEYDADTLRLEYERDVARGLDPAVPAHYFPDDNPAAQPLATWRSHAQLLYTNWLNYYVYQTTPYDLNQVGSPEAEAMGTREAEAEEGAATAELEVAMGATVAGAGPEAGKTTPEATTSAVATPSSEARRPAYTVRAVSAPVHAETRDPFLRPENEDDDGYDPFSDRPPTPEPSFQEDPWR